MFLLNSINAIGNLEKRLVEYFSLSMVVTGLGIVGGLLEMA
jgi:hypothetical protein